MKVTEQRNDISGQYKLGGVFYARMSQISIMIRAFTVYVRPMMEYCSPRWSPESIQLVNQLESVQRRFNKRLPGFNSSSYDERCTRLGINRLELRRLHADLILCYKIIHGYDCCS